MAKRQYLRPAMMGQKTKPIQALPDSNRHDLERRLGHIFENPNLMWEALQAAGNGVVQIGDRKIDDGNKKLAMLGDTILKLAILRDWFVSGEPRSKPTISTLLSSLHLHLTIKPEAGHNFQSHVGSNRHLDKCGRAAGLERYVNKNRSTKGFVPKSTMSAAVEALIGAVFIDSGESLHAVKVAIKGLGLLDEAVKGSDDVLRMVALRY